MDSKCSTSTCSPSPGKRKRKILSLMAKLEIIEEHERGKSRGELMGKYGLKKTTIHDILKAKDKIKERVKKLESGPKGAELYRSRKLPVGGLDEAVYEWYTQQRDDGLPIRGFQRAVERLAASLGHENFKCSDGWLWRFRRRHGIVNKTFSAGGEMLNNSDTETANPFTDGMGNHTALGSTERCQNKESLKNSANILTLASKRHKSVIERKFFRHEYQEQQSQPQQSVQDALKSTQQTSPNKVLEQLQYVEESRNERLLKQMLYQMTPQAQQQQNQPQPQPQQKMNISAALGKPVNPERSRKSSLKTALTCYSTLASQNIEVENDFLPAKKARDIQFESNVSETSTIFTKPVFQPTTECPAQKSVTTSVKPLSVVLKPTRDINARPKQKRILVVPNHQQSVMSNLSSLWKAGRLCDAFIGNGTVNLKVHKMILGAVCPKVLDLFYDTPQHKLPKVTFPSSVSKDALLAFAEYMYNGVLDLDPRLLDQMKVIAKQLDMKDFEQLCSNQLKSSLVPTILPNIVEPMLEEPCSSSGLLQLMSPQSGQTISAAGNNCSSGGTDSFANLPLVEVRAETDDTLMEVVNNNLTLSVVAKDEGSICDINTSNRPWVKIENVDPDDERYGREVLSSGVGYSTPNNISISTSNFTHISNTNSTQSSSLPLSTSTTQHTNSKQNKSLPVGHTWKQNHKEKQNLGGDLDPTDPYPISLFTANWSNVPLVDQEIKKEYNVG